MRDFGDDLLVIRPGWIVGDDGDWYIEIPLAPFSAEEEHDPATWRAGTDGPDLVETSIVAECVRLPGGSASDLAGQRFTFPVNPDDGYIDASIYLGASHNPVDITAIAFGALGEGGLRATITCRLDFEYELRDVASREAVLEAVLSPEMPPHLL